MAEPEELVSDAARHATVYIQQLWRRYQPPVKAPPTTRLADVGPRLELLLKATFGVGFALRAAQLPPRPTLLSILFKRYRRPYRTGPIPATDGRSLWLPPDSELTVSPAARTLYRAMALQQAARMLRYSTSVLRQDKSRLQADVYLLLEAYAADHTLVSMLPGCATAVDQLRKHALSKRPPLDDFPAQRQPLERLLRCVLRTPAAGQVSGFPLTESASDSLAHVGAVIARWELLQDGVSERLLGAEPLLKDWWTGELRAPSPAATDIAMAGEGAGTGDEKSGPISSARLERQPEVREALDGEDEEQEHASPWMVQGDEPHQKAEDPLGMQRPMDRDDEISADDYGDMISELPEARLVSTPGRPKEVLISDDPPDARAKNQLREAIKHDHGIVYPEWDYRLHAYLPKGATVRLLHPATGSQYWVDETLATHKSMLYAIRRRFEMLRSRRVWQRKRLDGDEIDIDAYIDSYAAFRAGSWLHEAVYQTRRIDDRDLAISLLIDTSGSTDSWVAAHRRIIDVEREALLLVCNALEGLGEPYAVHAFSGEGPHAVTVRQIKDFDEQYGNDIALRISSLEPEHYTRAGAAIRHATAGLMRQSAAHRLLLMLSDGKPNDQDAYEGRYGVEDTRQAVTEARAQGIHTFCLTIDRQAADYLPRIFGAHHYALLPEPKRLPAVLLDWMRRLIVS